MQAVCARVCNKYNFKGVVSWCPLFRGNYALQSAWILSAVRNREASASRRLFTTMVISIRNTDSVRYREVVRFSEGPLSEVRLYIVLTVYHIAYISMHYNSHTHATLKCSYTPTPAHTNAWITVNYLQSWPQKLPHLGLIRGIQQFSGFVQGDIGDSCNCVSARRSGMCSAAQLIYQHSIGPAVASPRQRRLFVLRRDVSLHQRLQCFASEMQ